jgi:hypothetical protein
MNIKRKAAIIRNESTKNKRGSAVILPLYVQKTVLQNCLLAQPFVLITPELQSKVISK